MRTIWVASVGILALILTVALFACATEETPTPTPTTLPSSAPVPTGFENPELLVDTAWLGQRLEDAAVRVLDVRSANDYQEGHIPGAVNVTTSQFTSTVNDLPNMLTPQQDFVTLMEQAGVGDDTHVIIVDAGNMLWASRLLWTLEYYGHSNTSILYGGQAAWVADGREVTRRAPAVTAASFSATPNPYLVVDISEVLQRLDDPSLVMLDNRSPAEYSGEDVRAARGGHVPGAGNVNWSLHLAQGDVPTLKSAAELRGLYESVGITRGKEVASYCQTGIRATHGYLVLRLLGYENLRVYDGSWVEWGNRQDTPIE